jgi:hypothetical protein
MVEMCVCHWRYWKIPHPASSHRITKKLLFEFEIVKIE